MQKRYAISLENSSTLQFYIFILFVIKAKWLRSFGRGKQVQLKPSEKETCFTVLWYSEQNKNMPRFHPISHASNVTAFDLESNVVWFHFHLLFNSCLT